MRTRSITAVVAATLLTACSITGSGASPADPASLADAAGASSLGDQATGGNGPEADAADIAAANASAPPITVGVPLPDPDPSSPYCALTAQAGSLDVYATAPSGDPAAVGDAVARARDLFGRLVAASPAPIASFWNDLAGAYSLLYDALDAAGYDPTAMMETPANAVLFEQLGSRSLSEAATNVDAFTAALCGTALGLGAAAPVVAAAPAVTGASNDGAALLATLGVQATEEQTACFDAAIRDQAAVTRAVTEDPGVNALRALAAACGIDTSAVAS